MPNDMTPAEVVDAVPVAVPQMAVAMADPMVSMIERVVMNPDADLDKLERMLAMKERLDQNNARVAFAGALSAARAQIPPIVKDATVDFSTKGGGRTNYKHETLAGIAKVIDPVLAVHGLSYRFRTGQGNGGVTVTCIIAHAAGHSEETSLSCAPDGSGSKNAFQAVGSAVTYLQRYTLKAALGLSAEVDDDAQSAAPRPDERQQHQEPRRDQRQSRQDPQRMQEPPRTAEPRNPDEVRDSLIGLIVRAASQQALDDMNTDGTKFAAAWQWLEDLHRDHAVEVKMAFDKRHKALAPITGAEIPY